MYEHDYTTHMTRLQVMEKTIKPLHEQKFWGEEYNNEDVQENLGGDWMG